MAETLTIIIPVYDEASHLAATIDAAAAAVAQTDFEGDMVVVDDGSTDGSGAAAATAAHGRIPCTVVTQPNRGRFHAVREGLRRATGNYVFVLGARVNVRISALKFVRERQQQGELIWVGHVHIHTERNPYGRFQNVLTEVAWRDYFDHPRTVAFGIAEFDGLPEGQRVPGRAARARPRCLRPRARSLHRRPLCQRRHADAASTGRDARDPRLARVRVRLHPTRNVADVPQAFLPPWDGLPRRARTARVAVLPCNCGVLSAERGRGARMRRQAQSRTRWSSPRPRVRRGSSLRRPAAHAATQAPSPPLHRYGPWPSARVSGVDSACSWLDDVAERVCRWTT